MSENQTPTTDSKEQGRRRVLRGVVTSDKMDKTVVVKVSRRVMHKRYKKYITQRATYKVHDENNEVGHGDTVANLECRPLSRDKRWRVKKIVERAK